METKELAELFITATGKIEFYWNFFTVTVLALIGWLAAGNHVLTLRLKILVTVGYSLFVMMNIFGLLGSYEFAEALRLDLLASARNDADSLEHARRVLSERSFEQQKTLVFFIHAAVAAVVLFAVWGRALHDILPAGDSSHKD
jgi:hypothetical protein